MVVELNLNTQILSLNSLQLTKIPWHLDAFDIILFVINRGRRFAKVVNINKLHEIITESKHTFVHCEGREMCSNQYQIDSILLPFDNNYK